ncbi:MAG: hypothetical protein EZS28_044692 [Streblomastix strix]|uniref:Uncharacterized protein n=1 Tax=Streblomastix strix TaxID=222440 RepID=A0A5J4TQS5_9EUKA|nr:MAG: hypothetical protein EZS28_044692 [Streblomastix strix]
MSSSLLRVRKVFALLLLFLYELKEGDKGGEIDQYQNLNDKGDISEGVTIVSIQSIWDGDSIDGLDDKVYVGDTRVQVGDQISNIQLGGFDVSS